MSAERVRPVDDADAQQRRAADPSHSAWVSANAGTGKTRVLTDRIARLLLRRVRPEKILCLTYTKAAAAEMKNRITDRLGKWAGMNDDALRAELVRLVGRDPQQADLVRARRLFAATLEAPGGGVNIRTIHAFCESLLARFPIEVGIAPHAVIMDELEARSLQREAQQRVFDQIKVGRDGAADLKQSVDYLAGRLQPEDFTALIAGLVGARDRLNRAIEGHSGLDGMIAAIYRAFDLEPGDDADALVASACADGAFDRESLAGAAAVFRGGNKTEQKHAPVISKWIEASPRDRAGELWPAYTNVYLTGNGTPRADRGLISKVTMESRADIDRIIHQEQSRIASVVEKQRALRMADGTRHLLSIGDALIRTYEDIKRERALLDYDDLIWKALALLESEHAVSWVHYKLDGGIDHILVDEAQDTSPPQWDIIRNLSLEMFSGEGTRELLTEDPDQEPLPPPDRSIFAVGDEKQSIYSFQGADPAGFATARDWFDERARQVGKRLEAVELIQSFRTTKPVLDAVDAVFARAPARDGVVEDEIELRHLPFRHDHAGAIELWPAIERRDTGDENPWLPLDEVREESPLAQTAERIARTIKGWIDSAEPLPSLGRPVNAGDIMILVERRTQFAEEMVKRLKSHGIDVAGSDRMKLTEQIAVMDLVAAANTALLVDDDLTLAVVLKGPFVGLSEEDLYTLAHRRTGSLWDALQARADDGAEPWQAARDRIAAIRARADVLPPYEFFAWILGAGGGRRKLYARLGVEAGDPIDEFLGLALLFERDHPPSLQGFLRWAEQGATEIKRDMEVVHRAVRVMTVHGAKGLEAPIVILPDTCGDHTAKKTPPLLWLDGADGKPALPLWPGHRDNHTERVAALKEAADAGSAAENHRLLYVAMTRARDRLHVTGWERGRKAKNAEHGRKPGSWYELIRPALGGMKDSETFDAPGGEGRRVVSEQVAAPEPEDAGEQTASDRLDPESWMTAAPPPEVDPTRPADAVPARRR